MKEIPLAKLSMLERFTKIIDKNDNNHMVISVWKFSLDL